MTKRTWKWPILAFVAFGTALLGEVKITPFGSAFRFGLGSMFFLFSLLFWLQLPLRRTGLVVGLDPAGGSLAAGVGGSVVG